MPSFSKKWVSIILSTDLLASKTMIISRISRIVVWKYSGLILTLMHKWPIFNCYIENLQFFLSIMHRTQHNKQNTNTMLPRLKHCFKVWLFLMVFCIRISDIKTHDSTGIMSWTVLIIFHKKALNSCSKESL